MTEARIKRATVVYLSDNSLKASAHCHAFLVFIIPRTQRPYHPTAQGVAHVYVQEKFDFNRVTFKLFGLVHFTAFLETPNGIQDVQTGTGYEERVVEEKIPASECIIQMSDAAPPFMVPPLRIKCDPLQVWVREGLGTETVSNKYVGAAKRSPCTHIIPAPGTESLRGGEKMEHRGDSHGEMELQLRAAPPTTTTKSGEKERKKGGVRGGDSEGQRSKEYISGRMSRPLDKSRREGSRAPEAGNRTDQMLGRMQKILGERGNQTNKRRERNKKNRGGAVEKCDGDHEKRTLGRKRKRRQQGPCAHEESKSLYGMTVCAWKRSSAKRETVAQRREKRGVKETRKR
ncbi:hypothetical protein K438DRAFT_1771238 [Mycena galopus ATCC 62051]|nr:hypothetical protein K438DRAFT_1771238 [Mycena galopus ATCC 62051]